MSRHGPWLLAVFSGLLFVCCNGDDSAGDGGADRPDESAFPDDSGASDDAGDEGIDNAPADDGGEDTDHDPGKRPLFASGFEAGVTLDPPVVEGNQWWQHIHGADVTGYNWDSGLPGKNLIRFQYLVGSDKDIDQFVHTRLEEVVGCDGQPTRALYQEVLQDDPDFVASTRNQAYFVAAAELFDQMYVRYWIKFQDDFAQHLDPSTGWRNLMEWRGDGFRWAIYVYRKDDVVYWNVRADESPAPVIWQVPNKDVAVPIGEWFLLEAFWRLTTDGDDQVQVAVNGQTICDYRENSTVMKPALDSYHVFKLYGNIGKVFHWIDDVEFWDAVPCGIFPCH